VLRAAPAGSGGVGRWAQGRRAGCGASRMGGQCRCRHSDCDTSALERMGAASSVGHGDQHPQCSTGAPTPEKRVTYQLAALVQ